MKLKLYAIWALLIILSMVACTPGAPEAAAPEPTMVENQPLTSTAAPSPTRTELPQEATAPPLPTAPPTPTNQPAFTPVMDAPKNVILVVVDSLRADHVSSYGYSRATTPNLDRLITENGARFEYAIASAPWTCPSNASLMSGKMPGVLGVSWERTNPSLPRQEVALAEHLQKAGFLTAGFVNNVCVSAKIGFSQGFDFFEDTFLQRKNTDTSNKVRAAEMNGVVMQWLDRYWVNAGVNKPQVFLFIYYMEPHVWYDPPAPYDTLFDSDYTGPITPEVFGIGKEVVGGRLTLDERDKEHVIALYDGEIASWDAQFATLLDYLTEIGMLEDTLVIVTGDHGELLGEHDLWAHGNGLQEELLRVPLVMLYPGAIPAGSRITSPVQMMDIMPTILDWANLPIPADLQATSIRALAQGGSQAVRPVFSEIDGVVDSHHWAYWQAPHEDLYSVYQDGWKLILHTGDPSLNELYQLKAQAPYEKENLLAQETGLAATLRDLIQQWFGK